MREVEEPLENARADPVLEPAMTGLIGRIALREVFPLGSGPQNPENTIEHLPRLAPGAPAAIGPTWRRRNDRL